MLNFSLSQADQMCFKKLFDLHSNFPFCLWLQSEKASFCVFFAEVFVETSVLLSITNVLEPLYRSFFEDF